MTKRIIIVFLSFFIGSSPLFSQVRRTPIKKETHNERGATLKENKISKRTEAEDKSQNSSYQSPGVYIEEIDPNPPSVVQVETAIPAFIGYTEKGSTQPTQINSLGEYKTLFGGPSNEELAGFEINTDGTINVPTISATPKYLMYYMLEMFFANGGGKCFIVSVGQYGTYQSSIENNKILAGLHILNNQDLPTLILFPDATSSMNTGNPAELYKAALAQCADRKDRFLICDVKGIENDTPRAIEEFRFGMGSQNLKYGAAYFPFLQTDLKYTYAEDKIKVKLNKNGKILVLKDSSKPEQSLYHTENGIYRNLYQEIKSIINTQKLILPPSSAIAGVYVTTDGTRGVWKAPANVSLNRVQAPTIEVSNSDQESLNIDPSGKSINAIRSFESKGVMVWGARTLAGNDNEWRYISVQRFFNMVEESVKNATAHFTFEPNDANTWVNVRSMIENYLTELWREGALQGSKPEHAFYVRVGLGNTMTGQDVINGKMIVEIGLATLRPAEFIILRFTQEMGEN